MLLDEGLHVGKLEPNHGPRPVSVAHARNPNAWKLPALRQLVDEGKAYLQNPFHLFCVKQLHFSALGRVWPFFIVSKKLPAGPSRERPKKPLPLKPSRYGNHSADMVRVPASGFLDCLVEIGAVVGCYQGFHIQFAAPWFSRGFSV
jgi:hypothetical protein